MLIIIKGTFYNTFSGAPPVGTGQSVVIRGSLTGTNWVSYNNHYMNIYYSWWIDTNNVKFI